MTKHDPAEIEAVANRIQGAYRFIRGTEVDPLRSDDAWAAIAEAAITALDAHRAPAIRAAVVHYGTMCFEYGRDGDGGDASPEFESMDKAQTALLAICGINEQENA